MKEQNTLTSGISQLSDCAIQPIRDQSNATIRRKTCLSFIHTKVYALISILILALTLPSIANAHRGARGEIDTCRISVGNEVIHVSAYTPQISGGRSYCQIIPGIGLTDLVIDYEGTKLRQTTVEFEVTKEPEGSRVYYHNPEKIKKGSIDAKVDFSKHGAGNYLLHVTVLNEGETIDSHLPFSVGIEDEESSMIPLKIIIPLIIVIIIFIVMFGMSKSDKRQPPSEGEPEA